MKKTSLFAIVLVFALIVVLLLRFRLSSGGDERTQAGNGSSIQQTNATNPQLVATNRHKPGIESAITLRTNARLAAAETVSAHEQRLRMAVAEMNRPVNFWGMVVDQDGAPLADARIEMSLRQWAFPMDGRFPAFRVASDVNGRFELTGESGDVLEFKSIKKDGYRLSPKALTAINYEKAPAPRTRDNPVIFKMWKTGARESLITGSRFFGIIPDGRTYTVDLVMGTKTEGPDAYGDLRIAIVRPAVIQSRQHYEWSFTIEGVNGGVLEAREEFMYLAPESGYEPFYQTIYKSSQEDWVGQCSREFFIRSRGGMLYGRLEVEVISDYNDQSVFSIKYAVNPNSSRNLEGSVP